jgi:hypothetical protein
MQIVPVWPPVAQISVDLFMLHATGGHSITIYMQLAASRMQHFHGRQSHATFPWRQLHATFPWPPVAYNISMAASCMQHFHGRQLHAKFACAGGQYSAKPPVFFNPTARTIVVKNEDTI